MIIFLLTIWLFLLSVALWYFYLKFNTITKANQKAIICKKAEQEKIKDNLLHLEELTAQLSSPISETGVFNTIDKHERMNNNAGIQ